MAVPDRVRPTAEAGPAVSVWPLSPFSLEYGGFEIQALESVHAARSLGSLSWLSFADADADFDVLHLFGPPLDAAAVMRNIGRRGLVVSTLAGADSSSRLRASATRQVARALRRVSMRTVHDLYAGIFDRADVTICLNDLEREHFQQRYKLSSDRIAVIPNGVRGEFRGATPDVFVERYGLRDFVLFVGSICARKNPLLLAEAMSLTDVPTVFVGPTSSEASYVQRFRSAVDACPNLYYLGALDRADPELASAYAGAQLLCLPSVAETQPLVAMEALAAGARVALADRPYAKQPPFESVSRVSVSSADALRRDVLAALRSAPRAGLGDEYSWEAVAERLWAVYERVYAQVTGGQR